MSTPWRILLSVLVIALSGWAVYDREPQLGLDLQGGTQVVLDLKAREGEQLSSSAANETREILRNRVDSLGVAEPNLETSGNSRIIVELPGLKDPQQAIDLIGTTAQLSFHRVQGVSQQQAPPAATAPTEGGVTPPVSAPAESTPPTSTAGLGAPGNDTTVLGAPAPQSPATSAPAPDAAAGGAAPAGGQPLVLPDESGQMLQLGPTVITGEGVKTATAQPPDQQTPSWFIDLQFKDDAAGQWTKLTGEAACAPSGDPTRRVAIVLDNKVISSPEVSASGSSPVQCGVGITGNRTQITGTFAAADAKDLALLIRGGALPVNVSIASQQTIGPELGDEAIDASIHAVIVGGILTILYLLLYYRLLGVLASIALGAYGLISYAVLLGVNLTLTLPGIAGFILAIAMAMDSNVLVYERSKEELDHGRSMKSASRIGFKNALTAIIDSNVTTFLVALTLYFLAIGEVRGFGVTLLIGTAVSIFTTLVVLRTLVTGLFGLPWANRHQRAVGIKVGARLRARLENNPPDVMRWGKQFLAAALLITVVALAGVFVKGLNYGIEFTGGRLMEYSTAQTVNADDARAAVDSLNIDGAVVQRSGDDDISIRIPDVGKEQLDAIDAKMKELGGGTADRVRDERVGGSFSNELRNKALLGLIAGVLVQLAFIAWRFRWNFGVGAVMAMIHDVLVVVGVFAWLGKTVDAVFIAGLLTVIAFSVNDSVVIFDRIREQRRRRGGDAFVSVVNDACVQTFPRTVNITLSAIFILLALLFLGGDTLGDFALALVLGIVAGTYSSVAVAAPIAIFLEKLKPSSGGRMGPAKNARTKKAKPSAVLDADDGEAASGDAPRVVATPAPRPRKKSGKKKR